MVEKEAGKSKGAAEDALHKLGELKLERKREALEKARVKAKEAVAKKKARRTVNLSRVGRVGLGSLRHKRVELHIGRGRPKGHTQGMCMIIVMMLGPRVRNDLQILAVLFSPLPEPLLTDVHG